MNKIFLYAVLLSLLPYLVGAQVNQPDSLDKGFSFDLDALLNMEVKVASKKSEKISEAPGMITSYSSSDVERLGYYTIKDLSNITSGYSSFSAFGETNLETRGQKAGSWNVSKHLLLIDGIPVNHSRANSAPLEYQVPIFFAEKVEFLKGPGSALYGTSAFYGVMNVSSKKMENYGFKAESKVTHGNAGKSSRIMGNAISKNKMGQMDLSFSYYNKGFSGDSLGMDRGIFHYNNDNSIFLKTSYGFRKSFLKGFGLGVIYMRRNSHGGEFWGATPSPVNEVTWEQYIPYLKYQRQISDKLGVNSYLKCNGSNEKSTFGNSWVNMAPGSTPFSGYDYVTSNIEGSVEMNYKFSKTFNLIAGANYDTRKELGSPSSFAWNIMGPLDTTQSNSYSFNRLDYDGTLRVNVASVYTQLRNEFKVLDGLIVTAGGRLDNGFSEAANYTQFSPRLALVQRLTKGFNIKALYGQALRVPGIKEIGLNNEIKKEIEENGGTGDVNAIPDVEAEVIKSFEGGLNYSKDKINIAFAYFYNITSGALDGAQYSYVDKNSQNLTVNYFSNASGEIRSNGFEFDLQYAYNKNFRVMINHAMAKAVIHDTVNFIDVPSQKSNAALTFVTPGKFKLSSTIVVKHVWGYYVKAGEYDSRLLRLDSETELKGFTNIDLNFLIPINKNVGFEFQARNLLDTKWKQPSLLGSTSMIPIERRNLLITIYSKF